MSFGFTHIKTSYAGQFGYYQPLPNDRCLEVFADNERDIFELPERSELREWKPWYLDGVREQYFNRCRLVGRFPCYRLEVG